MNLKCTEISFDLKEPLNNEGKNSSVYLAYDCQLDSDFVVKIVPIEDFLKLDNTYTPDNFFNESRILYNNQHPNIMKIQYASFDEENIYFSMPLCKNGSLNALINSRFLSVREIIKYSLEFLSGLHYIHTNQIMHFDIKPTNILISNSGKALLTDFGFSKRLDKYGLASPDKIYTKHYPPEGISSYTKYNNQADIYQAGVTLYRLCNGNNIFNQMANQYSRDELYTKIQNGKFPDRNFYLPHIPSKLRKIINKAMNIGLNKRYTTVLSMINDISKIEDNLDWRYNNISNIETWSIFNANRTHIEKIILNYDKNEWCTLGEKIRISDNKTTKISEYTQKGIKSKTEAYKLIEKMLQ